MKIPELDFGKVQLNRTDVNHFGNGKIKSVTQNLYSSEPVSKTAGIDRKSQAASVQPASQTKSFQDYLIEAVSTVNTQQIEVADIQEKLITNPDNVDIHDVTIAMSKARMSLNLAQTVIDRIVSGWNDITTTR